MPYGAFIDLGGVEGLLHISDISWKRISSVDAVLHTGEKLQVLVQKFDKERNRISLSLKALQKNPWIAAIEKFEVGDIVKGEVKKAPAFRRYLGHRSGITGLAPHFRIDGKTRRCCQRPGQHQRCHERQDHRHRYG